MNVLFKVPNLDEFLHQVMQTLTVFSGVTVILMVKAPSVSVLSNQIFLDWLWPFEVDRLHICGRSLS